MKRLEISVGALVGLYNSGTIVIVALGTKWKEELREVYDNIDVMSVFVGCKWFRFQRVCIDSIEKHTP